MHQKTGKKIKFFFYSLLIIILTSTNNYKLLNKNIFNIKYISVEGFSEEKNELIKNEIKNLYEKNILFISKNYFKDLLNRNDIKYLFIKKNFPNKLIINFIPAKPIYIIENYNNKIILGDNGKILKTEQKENNFPTVSGSDDIENIYNVVNLINLSNLDYKMISEIKFFKSGRFDVYLSKGIIIKFPIKFNQKIINYSSELLNRKEFTNSKVIDLRVKNKIIKYE